jgi:hypothetical protein
VTAHAQRGHAKLSPSASKRWMSCPGSIRMSEGIPNTSSRFADEGTAAHELAQHCLETGFDADRFLDTYIDLDGETKAEKFLQKAHGERCFVVDEEMVDGVGQYLDFVREIMIGKDVESETEQWLDLSHLGVEGLDGGTGDFLGYDPHGQVLDIVDLKYGRGVAVEPKDNSQGLCYAVGAVNRFHNRGLKLLRISIVQPRCPHPEGPIRTWECDVVDLLDFKADLIDAAKKTRQAADMQRIALDQDQWRQMYLTPGEHCKFCPAAPTCPARRDQAFAIAQAEFSALGEMELPIVEQMKPEDLAKVLREVDQLEDFARRVKEYAHHEATHGRCPPGFKLVAKRANRKWKDEEAASSLLGDMLGDAIFTEPRLKTPAQVEPLMPGKNKGARAKALESLVSKESSGTVLALESDARPAVRADANEFAEAS